jgi:membrane-associated phospholipid phosphatase
MNSSKPEIYPKQTANAKTRGFRLLLVILGLAAWFWTQTLIGQRAVPGKIIGDELQVLTAPTHQYLLDHPRAADGLLIASSAGIDLLAIFLLARAIFGPTFRPFIGLLLLFTLRQICQALCALPPPEEMIWRNPGFPSLVVTYGVANDLFFSGHTAIAVFGAIELARLGRRWLGVLGFGIALFEMTAVLTLRAHYTMDVFTGAVTALLVAVVAAKISPGCDRTLARLTGRKPAGTAGPG